MAQTLSVGNRTLAVRGAPSPSPQEKTDEGTKKKPSKAKKSTKKSNQTTTSAKKSGQSKEKGTVFPAESLKSSPSQEKLVYKHETHEEFIHQGASVAAMGRARGKLRESIREISVRDIANCPEGANLRPINFSAINWERRLACKADPVLFLQTYMPDVFYLGFADFHIRLIREIQDRMVYGGRKALALPRGGGKTAVCRGMLIWATGYGIRKYGFFIGAKSDKAEQTLNYIRVWWHRSPLAQQDFPEIAYPVYRIEGRSTTSSAGQLYKGERTYITWASDEVMYPCLLMDQRDAEHYLAHDPESVQLRPEYGKYMAASAGTRIRVAGIDGSIRGEADVHPVTLAQPRPDLILLDDVQKDQSAASPATCTAIERLIEAAVDNLSSRDIAQTCLMPCTVIREGDVSDLYLTPDKKPDWAGERYGLVKKFPPGMDYDHIYEEVDGKPNTQGKLWLEYKEVREKSLRLYGNLKLANEFYRMNQVEMEKDFEVNWAESYKRGKKPNPDVDEISAIQSLMNLRFKDHLAYLSEQENRPRSSLSSGYISLTPQEVRERMTRLERGHCSIQWTNLVCFIDVQDEILFWTVLAHDVDFNGQFIDYGTYPEITVPYFRKHQLETWSLLSRDYYAKNRDAAPPATITGRTNLLRAPLEAKLYSALKHCVGSLLQKAYARTDGSEMRIRGLAIDTKWGDSSATVKQFVRELNNERVMCYEGHSFMPTFKQLEEYNPSPGWLFEHQLHPHTQESRWVVKPYQKGEFNQKFILSDVNRWKTFLMKRLNTPLGSAGAISLFYTPQGDLHRMFADHITSEVPEELDSRGITKTIWTPKPGFKNDNDYLDCAVGCLCLASICGASLKFNSSGEPVKVEKRSIRKVYEKKRGLK